MCLNMGNLPYTQRIISRVISVRLFFFFLIGFPMLYCSYGVQHIVLYHQYIWCSVIMTMFISMPMCMM
jgi:hypothetical protein